MPHTFIPSQFGKLEARYHHGGNDGPVTLLLHGHPSFGGNMNNPIMYQLYWDLAHHGHSVVRFNFRGVGLSEGVFSGEESELSDANTAFDWILQEFPGRKYNVVGFSFGAWVASNLTARRMEVEKLVAIAPLVDHYNFNFMVEFCPAKLLFVRGQLDSVVSKESMDSLAFALRYAKTNSQFREIEGANHFFDDRLYELVTEVTEFSS